MKHAVVITASNRAAAGTYPDRGGPIIVEALRAWGMDCGEPVVVPDGDPVEQALRTAVADGADLVITTGGTGLGLSIALEDTHLHGGWLQVGSVPGHGACFRLLLPRHDLYGRHAARRIADEAREHERERLTAALLPADAASPEVRTAYDVAHRSE